jgi:RNA ligase
MSTYYDFPLIQHISHVLPHIDDDCFRVVEKDSGHTFINYVKMGNDTFPAFETESYPFDPYDQDCVDKWNHRSAIRRECRGLAFHTASGALQSRPFHKFFNVGEREDMDIELLDFSARHWVCDKVDGSMLRPLWTSAGIRWGTKMGITDVALDAEAWIYQHAEYGRLAKWAIEHGKTPLFEYVGPHNRIVVEYPENMFLLAIRDNDTGAYWTPSQVSHIAAVYGVPSARIFDPIESDPTTYFAALRESDDLDEGVVIQWESGHRAKVKTDTYSILHKVKEASRTERTLVEAILEGKIDDLLPLLPQVDRDRVTVFVDKFWGATHRLAEDIDVLYNKAREDFATKKDFAIATAGKLTNLERAQVFGAWDKKIETALDGAMQIVKGGLTSETKWAEMKQKIAESTLFDDFATQWNNEETGE